MTTVNKYITAFNNLHDKSVKKKDILLLLKNVKAAKSPYLKDIELRLTNISQKMNGKPVTIKISNPVALIPDGKKVTKPVKSTPKPKQHQLRRKYLGGVVDASAIAELDFSEIELDGEWKEDFLRMYSDTQILVWGGPGSGKTVKLLKFAQYLAINKNMKVLFIANEEMNRSTLTEKIREFKIPKHPNLNFTADLDELKKSGKSISDYDMVLFDSVQSLGFNLERYKKFVKDNPGRIYILIIQSTKSGDFKGGKEWEHEVDIAGEVVNRKLILRKNRLDGTFAEKRQRLLLDEKVNEGKQRLEIREKIRGVTRSQDLGEAVELYTIPGL